jgi:hypothetical protein
LAADIGRARKYPIPLDKTGGDPEVDGMVVVHRHANVSRTTPYLMTSGGPKSSLLRLQRKEDQTGSANSRKRNQSLLKKVPGTKPPLQSSILGLSE